MAKFTIEISDEGGQLTMTSTPEPPFKGLDLDDPGQLPRAILMGLVVQEAGRKALTEHGFTQREARVNDEVVDMPVPT